MRGEIHLAVTQAELEDMDALRPALFIKNPMLALKLERAILSCHNRFAQKLGAPKRLLPAYPWKNKNKEPKLQ